MKYVLALLAAPFLVGAFALMLLAILVAVPGLLLHPASSAAAFCELGKWRKP